MGCIVNLRKDLGVDSRRTFGLFLGSFMVTHEVPEGMSLRELRALARREALEAAGASSSDAPLLLAGHQPEYVLLRRMKDQASVQVLRLERSYRGYKSHRVVVPGYRVLNAYYRPDSQVRRDLVQISYA